MTDDLISRQAAIDALKHNQDVYSANFGDDPIDKYTVAIIANDIETVVMLPTAQPESCEDAVSRQYAIEHYQHVCRRTSCKECPLHIQVTGTLTDCELELFLHNLPSAQIERKKGKWIKNEGRFGWHCSECKVDNYYAYVLNSETGKNDLQDRYCPNCGADMRGENNG